MNDMNFHWERLIRVIRKKIKIDGFRHSTSLASLPTAPYVFIDIAEGASDLTLYSKISNVVNNFNGNTEWLMKIGLPSTWVIIPQAVEAIIKRLILEAEQGIYFSSLSDLLDKNWILTRYTMRVAATQEVAKVYPELCRQALEDLPHLESKILSLFND